MNSPAKQVPWILGMGLLLLVLSLALAFMLAAAHSSTARNRLPVLGDVGDFTLTNQAAKKVTLTDLSGHPWVADIIFTRCPGPCLRMTKQMKELQDAMPEDNPARLVSLTTDPAYDTPPVLGQYSQRFGADGRRWVFLTGTQAQLGRLAAGGLKLAAVEKAPSERDSSDDLFIHSTIFVVVDGRGRLRGVFETGGEGVDWPAQKQKILAALNQLERDQ